VHRKHGAQVLVRAVFSNTLVPFMAWYCQSLCVTPKSSSPALMVLMLNTDPPVDSTEQRMPWRARSLFIRRQMAPPAA
jgi:hypothetical protein